MNLTGTWKGDYTIEDTKDGGSKLVAGTVVDFTMVLKSGWFGAIAGTVQDDPLTGFPEKGTIKGRLKGSVFIFEKIQPTMRMMHEKTRKTLEEIADQFNLVMDTTDPHPKIRHIGDISKDERTIEGTWLCPETPHPIPGSSQTIMLPKMAGTFKMKRV